MKRDGTARPVSRHQILGRKRGQGNVHFPCSAADDHDEQDWQLYPVDTYSCYYYVMTIIQYLKKNQSTSRPSEHPPVMGEKCQNV